MSDLQTALIKAGLISVLTIEQNTQHKVWEKSRYDGLWDCFRNVVRTNNRKKLSYCKTR